MTQEFITGLLPDVDKAVLDQILDENGRDVEAQKNTIAALTTERDTLKAQLETANNEIQSFKDMDIDGIQRKAAEWENRYTSETQALKEQLAAVEYGHCVKDAVSTLRFSSESAKKAFVTELTAKKLPVQEGKLLGLDDYVKSYRQSDPGAFLPENDGKMPVFVRGSGGQQPSVGNAFAFQFTGIRPHNNDNK